MNIDDLTLGQLKQIKAQTGDAAEHPFNIGANYFIRTVTMALTGRLERVTASELVLMDAAWIADTGRFAQAVASGEFDEVEPFPDGEVIVGRGALIDACVIPKLPRVQS